ncbi:hypothetical protein Lal_00048864 [Lupinus albus]|uniref:Putative succinate dehydrogenase (Quinone) n=1 Tax=Lupinus albus TaxID=3870 RepID=A0A6A4QEJ4_LUPAL|nr:putative succinate dehydrogenase (quinone) [Lupinus albus]KAF1880229.1 hypothetical protein Lal_00048864 [Lupinus albus]
MAENTRMKGLKDAINNLNATMQKMMEDSEARHNDYVQARQADMARLDQMEVQLNTLNNSVNSEGSSSHQQQQPLQVKLDFPKFDGSEVLNWIFKAEQFFNYYSTPDHHRITIASIHMEKDVVPWFQIMTRKNPFNSWAAFTQALELEYGPSPYESSRHALFKITQTTTVTAFYTAFTSLANYSHGLSPDAILDCFISGLKPEIRKEVLAQNPLTFSKAFSLAKLFEKKYNPSTEPSKPVNPIATKRNTNPTRPTHVAQRNSQLFNPRQCLVRSIIPAEIQFPRDEGLCFYCDGKFPFFGFSVGP